MVGFGSWVASLWMISGAAGLAAPDDPAQIVGGGAVGVCGLPTTVSSGGGCTGTLVHPRVISTAQHCGVPGQVSFGETAGVGPTVAVVGCVGDGSADAMLCELARDVPLPVTPVLYGCEVDQYMQVGQDVVIAGFGQTMFGEGGGTKLWAPQVITAVEPDRTIIGNAGDGVSPCPGDSGGPVFVQVADGSWRVFGTVLGGTTGIPCNSAADFQRIDPVVPNFEAQMGIDITPCFDAQTGMWEATEACGSFFAGDEQGVGAWDRWCAGTPVSGYSDACGVPFGDDGSDSSGGTEDTGNPGDPPPVGTDGGSSGAASDGAGRSTDTGTGGSTGGPALPGDGSGGTDSSGCGCTQPRSGGSWWLVMLAGVAVRRRRRALR